IDNTISTMADKMFEKFEKYWGDVHIVMAICTILDPHFKMKAVDFAFPTVYGARAVVEIENVRKICYDLVQEYQTKTKSRQLKGSSSSLTMPSTSGDGQANVKSKLVQYMTAITADEEQVSKYGASIKLFIFSPFY